MVCVVHIELGVASHDDVLVKMIGDDEVQISKPYKSDAALPSWDFRTVYDPGRIQATASRLRFELWVQTSTTAFFITHRMNYFIGSCEIVTTAPPGLHTLNCSDGSAAPQSPQLTLSMGFLFSPPPPSLPPPPPSSPDCDFFSEWTVDDIRYDTSRLSQATSGR